MYQRINWNRYCDQAARLHEAPIYRQPRPAPAPAFSLVKGTVRYEFTPAGDTVTVARLCRGNVVNAWTKSRDDARAYWRQLVSSGYSKF